MSFLRNEEKETYRYKCNGCGAKTVTQILGQPPTEAMRGWKIGSGNEHLCLACQNDPQARKDFGLTDKE